MLVETVSILVVITVSGTCTIKCSASLRADHAVAQLVEALRYKPVGRGFDSRWCHWNFSLI